MFNGTLKKSALAKLEESQVRHGEIAGAVSAASERLLALRKQSAGDVIARTSAYVSALAHSPKEFDQSFEEFRAECREFTGVVEALQAEATAVDLKSGAGITSGLAAGVGVVALGPTAAMAVATTFGTASTGAAISTLSGAAATKAALAWLGGGALAAGGAGAKGGAALLALAGPVGWGIAAAALGTGAVYARHKNKAVAEQAIEHQVAVEADIARLVVAKVGVEQLVEATETHMEGIERLLSWLGTRAPADYHDFSVEQKTKLGALVNHIHSLGQLINKRVEVAHAAS